MFRKNIEKIVDFLLPPRCVVSGEIVDKQGSISPEAWEGLEFISAPYCKICGVPFEFLAQDDSPENAGDTVCVSCLERNPAFEMARSALIYNDFSRDLILRFKHGDALHVRKSFTPWLLRAGKDIFPTVDLIVPVPLHRMRLLKRRYNQAALIAQDLSKAVAKPVLLNTLQRNRSTPTQGYLNYKQRHENVKRAFEVPKSAEGKLLGQNILLVDDVFTSGATIKECSKALKAAGAREIYVLTVARTRIN